MPLVEPSSASVSVSYSRKGQHRGFFPIWFVAYRNLYYRSTLWFTCRRTMIEKQTNKVTEEELNEIWRSADTCNAQAFNFQEQSDNDIVVKDALIRGSGIGHCFIHDRDRDVVIDACMGQFDQTPDMGAWDGDEHPYAIGGEEVREWESRGAFEEYYDGAPENDFIY